MSIDSIDAGLKGMTPIAPLNKPAQTGVTAGAEKKPSFGDVFNQALNEVNSLQQQAEGKIEDMMLGRNGVTNHDAMIALEKADTAFQLMSNIRAKIVRAYEEILRTQV